jgi:hypothetical protein
MVDIMINYALIVLLQTAVLSLGVQCHKMFISTLYLWAFQILLCLAVGCIGVSVVWSAQFGYLLHNRYFRSHKVADHPSTLQTLFFHLSLCSCMIAWFYYAVIEEPITTIAHLCAVAMGYLMDFVSVLWEDHTAAAKAPGSEPSGKVPLLSSRAA